MRSIVVPLGLVVALPVAPVRTDARRFDLADLTRIVRVADSRPTAVRSRPSPADLDEDRHGRR